VVSSLTLVHGQSFAQCALGSQEKNKKKCALVNIGKKWIENYVALGRGNPTPSRLVRPYYCSLLRFATDQDC